MRIIRLEAENGQHVIFAVDGDRAGPRLLFGLDCVEQAWSGVVFGPALLSVDTKRYEGYDIQFLNAESDETSATFTWRVDEGLILTTGWRLDPLTATLTRQDTLTNDRPVPVIIRRFFSRVAFERGDYELYAQSGRWATESQGAWLSLHAGRIALFCEEGRTAQNSAPYCCLRRRGDPTGVAVHLLPVGNWMIRLTSRPQMHGQAFAVLELGMGDDEFRLALPPGATFAAPEVWFQPLVDGRPESAAPTLHRAWLMRQPAARFAQPPVVYNTWLDEYDILQIDRLRAQLAAAKEVGAEVFVIDAGWFGTSDQPGSWFDQAGDWREKTNTAFCGRMADFAEEVRRAGLGFGLWMEPEHYGDQAPIRTQHPDWFKGSRLDLENPAARDWLKSEMRRLIETYKLAWLKVDFNVGLGVDEIGTELHGYYRAWYHLMDELKAAYPGIFFEGCSSGAMRLDLEVLRHFDMHFLSDTTNSLDTLRIGEATALRIPLGRVGRWLVLRSVGESIPTYPAGHSESYAVPATSGWQPRPCVETTDLDFAALAALPSVFGLSGDLQGISPAGRARIAAHVAFYKRWRGFLTDAHAHLLTPVCPIHERHGWVATQFCHPTRQESLLFVYRLQDGRNRMIFRLQDLQPDCRYRLSTFPAGLPQPEESRSGQDLERGLQVHLALPGSAVVYVLEPDTMLDHLEGDQA